MKLIILAAGQGSRLRPLTDTVPKCMVEMNSKPILSYLIDNINASNISDVTIVSGYRDNVIRNFAPRHFKFIHNSKFASTNMLYSLELALTDQEPDDIIVTYSDIVYFTPLVEIFAETSENIQIANVLDWKNVWDMRFEDPNTDLESFKLKGGNLIEIGKRITGLNSLDGQYAGIFKIPSHLIATFKQKINSLDVYRKHNWSMTEFFCYLIEEGTQLEVSDIEKWFEIDDISDLNAAERYFGYAEF